MNLAISGVAVPLGLSILGEDLGASISVAPVVAASVPAAVVVAVSLAVLVPALVPAVVVASPVVALALRRSVGGHHHRRAEGERSEHFAYVHVKHKGLDGRFGRVFRDAIKRPCVR